MQHKRTIHFLLTIVCFLLISPASAGNEQIYGPEALSGLKPYGIEVRLVTNPELSGHNQILLSHIKSKLASRGLTVLDEGSVILRLTITAISSDDGFYVVHFLIEALQAAYLAKDNAPTEAAVWDAYRMGEYREQDLIPAVDDLLRSFINDYISVN